MLIKSSKLMKETTILRNITLEMYIHHKSVRNFYNFTYETPILSFLSKLRVLK